MPFCDYTYSLQPDIVPPMNILCFCWFESQPQPLSISPMFPLDNYPVILAYLEKNNMQFSTELPTNTLSIHSIIYLTKKI